ncbi:hypothetical protein [Demequina sp. NBRC 110053]|uniref:hypothetical protein n=1 Tax=Demequina sp. NBRC 110053 TaxID=1570342 RepID=UPI000A0392F7|nr:hypothetical protein [Demequina sp. NBRC 110053]
MSALDIRQSLLALFEDAGFEWQLSEDATQLDVGPDLWQLFYRCVLNADGSIDLWRKRERSDGFVHKAWYASWSFAERSLAQDAGSASRRGAPTIMISGYPVDLDPRCSLTTELVDSVKWVGLHIGDELVARFGNAGDAAYESHLLTEDVEAIIASYRHPEGKPLFGLDDITPPSLRS